VGGERQKGDRGPEKTFDSTEGKTANEKRRPGKTGSTPSARKCRGTNHGGTKKKGEGIEKKGSSGVDGKRKYRTITITGGGISFRRIKKRGRKTM